jgi:hypothetical protein
MDAIIIALFIINNLIWMFWHYYMTPPAEKKKIPLPPILPGIITPEEKKIKDTNEEFLHDIADEGLRPSDVIKNMAAQPPKET